MPRYAAVSRPATTRYGLAVASPSRTVGAAARPRSGGMRTIALRLSRPQSISHGASVSGPKRLYELMVGLQTAASAGACWRTPAIADRAILDRPNSLSGSPKSGWPSSLMVEKWRWNPDPPSSLNGLAMNVASLHSCRASSLTADLMRNALSAAYRASECHRLISNWPLENSWLAATTSRLYADSWRRVRSRVFSGSPFRPET